MNLTKQVVDGKWEYQRTSRLPAVGEKIEFLCNGRGRGGHVVVFAEVTKVNRKTLKAVERQGSYYPGTHWTVDLHTNFTIQI